MPPKTQLVDHAGHPIRLGSSLGRGGEAEVFDVVGQPAVAAKIYHAHRDAAQSAKLSHMVARSSRELTRIAAWPTATLHEHRGGPQRGFLMPKMVGFKELHLLYGVKSRRASFPKAGWDFLLHAAMNCAAAFDTMHKAGIVVADVNSRNVCVGPDATVRLVDCDSFQLLAQGQQFLCEVGVPEYTPPELHGRPFAGVIRTPNHDCFGLAVLVFHLLFMGRHPFFGRFLGGGDMTQERAIAEMRFAFGSQAAARLMAPPPHSMALEMLPRPVSELFETAFTEAGARGQRPSASDWLIHLQLLSARLATCTVDDGHQYPRILRACPWCEAMDKGGPVFFAGGQLPLDFSCSRSDLAPLLAELDALLRKPSPIHLSPLPAAAPTPLSTPALQTQRQLLTYELAYVPLLACFTLASVVPPLLVLFGIPAGVIFLFRYLRYQGSPLEAEYKARAAANQSAYGETFRCGDLTLQFNDQLRKLTQGTSLEAVRIASNYADLQPSFEARLAALAHNARDTQRAAFLDAHQIVDANIPGFGRDRKARLISMGIESAWDVRKAPLPSISGIGEKLRDALEAWALEIERRFRFDASAAVPEGDRRVLVSQYRRQQGALRAELSQLLSSARTAVAKVVSEAPELWAQSAAADAQLAQARADASLIGKPFRRIGIVTAVMSLIALLFLITGASSQDRTEVSQAPAIAPVIEPIVRQMSASGLELLSAGAGESRLLRWGGLGTKKQLLQLVLDASTLAVSGSWNTPAELRLLAAVKDTKAGDVEVQFLVQSADVVTGLKGALLSFSLTSTGKLIEDRVLQWPKGLEHSAAKTALDGVKSVLSRLFVELPQERVSQGLSWRTRLAETVVVEEASPRQILLKIEAISGEKIVVQWRDGLPLPSLGGTFNGSKVSLVPL